MRRQAVAASVVLFAVTSIFARDLPSVDALSGKQSDPSAKSSIAARGADLLKPGMPLNVEARLGVPTMVWASGVTPPPFVNAGAKRSDTATSEGIARSFLAQYASLYKYDPSDASRASLIFVHDIGTGPIIAKFQQQVEGIEIFREEINVMMNRRNELVAIGGYISSATTPPARNGQMSFALDSRNAAANAYQDLTVLPFDASQLTPAGSRAGYDYFNLPASAQQAEPVRMKKVYFHLPEGLEPAYYVEVAVRDEVATVDGGSYGLDYYAYVISAIDGRVLFRHNLTVSGEARKEALKPKTAAGPNAFVYRVWADLNGVPYDTPAGNAVHPKVVASPDGFQATFVAQNDVTLANYPFSQNDPWLLSGTTTTLGNNVDAYVDLVTPDGFTSPTDFRATVTAADQFLHSNTPGTDVTTNEQRQSAIQQLFFNNNFLHDWYYDSGFTEVARNAQQSNYARGGVELDRIKAEAQDFSARNNANMATPADGGSPRMQMFVFDTAAPKYLQITAPAAIAGSQSIGTGQFGQQVFDLTNQIVQPSPVTGCTAASFTGTSGKFVLVDREPTAGAGSCSIGTKLNNAMAAGAAGFILVNLSTTPNTLVNVTGSLPTFTIPFISITWNGALPIKAQLAVPNVVTGRMVREAGTDRDGTIDNQIVFHEWGHYLSNRLIGNGSGLTSNQSGGMGEGWGDTNAMMLTVRPDDTATPSNATWNGAYALATYATSGGADGGLNQGYYYGIRRMPYSTDMTRNSLTYKHIANGQAISGAPILFGADGSSNAEVHNTGEVWAEMLWECYASLLRDTQGASPRLTFTQAQTRWRSYLVASLKMTPFNPTFPEARDAVLAAAYATDLVDYNEFWTAFAKRGLGSGATPVANRDSTDNTGITESFVTLPDLVFDHVVIDDSGSSCDNDGILDGGESGHVTVYLRNTGTTRLTGITGTLATTTSGFTVAGGGALIFQDVDPLGITAATAGVSASGAVSGVTQADFTLQYTQASLASIPRNSAFSFATNFDVIPASTATDTVESPNVKWTASASAVPHGLSFAPFHRIAVTPLQHVWHADDIGTTSDERLTSPVFTINGGGTVNIQLDHSWGFEFDGGGNYDGGIIEMSRNGGAFASIGGTGTVPYNGTLVVYTGNTNPLQGQQAFVQNSAGTVHSSFSPAGVAPGDTVQFRFRVASDSGFGAAGWNIDNIAITGVVETPFDTVVADSGCAAPTAPTTTTLTPGANPSPVGASLLLTATISASGPAPNSGTVTFYDGASPLGTTPVTAGQATLSTSSLSMGPHSLTATFNGAGGYDPSTSANVIETISKAIASVLLGSSANPVLVGGSVTLTATVSMAAGTPVGSVIFYDGATPLATISLTGGVATYTTTAFTQGMHATTAAYQGNTTTLAATSNTVSEAVATPAPTITPGGPTTFCAGGSVTLSSDSATGNQWLLNGNPIGGATNQTYAATASGNYTATVTANSVTSAPSNTIAVTVTPLPATPTITPGGATTFCAGGNVTLTSSSASGNQWFLNGNPIGGATNNTYVANASGSYTVTVTASGCSSAPSSATVVTVNPIPNATITTAASVPALSTGNPASVANAGVGATYTWGITGGTITAGAGTANITYTAGGVGTLTLNVTVTLSGCSDSKSANVSVTAPAVTVTSVSPTGGTIAGGSAVTVNGTGFLAGASVTFGGSAATNVVVVSSIKITARTPAHALGSVDVTVTNTNTANGTLVGGYLYKAQQFDPNNDGTITSSDIFYLVNYLFMSGPAPMGAAGVLSGDANGDGVVNALDIFYLVNYLFLGGPRPNAIPNNPRVVAEAAGAQTPELSGSITLGKPVLRAGRYVVPVIMTAGEGSIAPQAMSLRVHFGGEGTIGEATIRRAGAAKDLATAFEINRVSGDDLSYVVSYGNLTLGNSRSAVVAEIELASVDGNIALSIDPQLTMLSDQGGMRSATVSGGNLKVNGTSIGGSGTPRPRTPGHDAN